MNQCKQIKQLLHRLENYLSNCLVLKQEKYITDLNLSFNKK